MATKDSDKNQWKDPKDFGLPWVEIKPIKEISPIEEISNQEEAKESPKIITPTQENVIPTKPMEEAVIKKKAESKVKPVSKPVNNPNKKDEKSFAWAWVVVALAGAIVGVIIWQMQTSSPEDIAPAKAEIQTEVPTPSPVEVQDSSAVATLEENSGNPEAQEKNSQADLNISKPAESGTTIAQTVKGNLIRIENQSERPQYFIVVGSVPSEQDAVKLAPGFQARVPEVFLIHPYSESSNYRLAIGKFGSFRSAAEELEKIKSQYTEELWILKY